MNIPQKFIICLLMFVFTACEGEGLPVISLPSEQSEKPGYKIFKQKYARLNEIEKEITPIFKLQQDLPPVYPGEWRSFWKEPEQSPERYIRSFPNTPTAERDALYLRIVGEMDTEDRERVNKIRKFLAINFQCPVKIGPPVALSMFKKEALKATRNGLLKINSIFLTDEILKPALPSDAWGVLAITSHDIYKGEGLDKLYGDSLLFGKAGVISLYHLRQFDFAQTSLSRALKGASHESSHMLSIPHCSEYRCNMNGRITMKEFDRSPLYYCNSCLSKLLYATKANARGRFIEMRNIAREYNLKDEVDYYNKVDKILADIQP